MKIIGYYLILTSLLLIVTSCAPVKFTKSDKLSIDVECASSSCAQSQKSIICDPKINSNSLNFIYVNKETALPSVNANCTPTADLNYIWSVRRADYSLVNNSVGLVGSNPSAVNMLSLGQGTYYVFLSAKKIGSGLLEYKSQTPLEFVVQGSGVGNSLTCDPKLNGNVNNLNISGKESNPTVSANCVPRAGAYFWSATKDGKNFIVSGLSGASATPDFKKLGNGEYQLSLYATATGSTHWQSAVPLVVKVGEQTILSEDSINCNPNINGSLNYLTVTAASSHSLIMANCTGAVSQYNWVVTKNGFNVVIPELMGASAYVDFLKFGKGTYLVYLKSQNDKNGTWSSTKPLSVRVEEETKSVNLNCSPRLNGKNIKLNITTSAENPKVTAGCDGAATLNWLVLKDGKSIEIAGLSGANSVGQFAQAGVGNYKIYLNANAKNLNSFINAQPLEIYVTEKNESSRKIIFEKLITENDKKVDIVLIVDDSNSMLSDNVKLAQKLEGFSRELTGLGLDWQICATVTRWQDDNPEKAAYWGLTRKWVNHIGNPQWILNAGANNLGPVFADTFSAIGAGWANTDDERGIKALWHNIEYNEFNNCHREGATLAALVISDEDERSLGGNPAYVYYDNEFKTLEVEDFPESIVAKVKEKFGESKRFLFNSIIVKPSDSFCMNQQDMSDSKSHFGFKYDELSDLTGGVVGSICDSDYANTLNTIKERIIETQSTYNLECSPVGEVKVMVTPTIAGFTAELNNNRVVLNSAVPRNRIVKIEYQCPLN